jgi:hypothetical protein
MKPRVAIGFAWVLLLVAAAGCAHETWDTYAQGRGSSAVDASRTVRQTRQDYTLIPPGVR